MRRPIHFLKNIQFSKYTRASRIGTLLKYQSVSMFNYMRKNKTKTLLGGIILVGIYQREKVLQYYKEKKVEIQNKIEQALAKDSYIDKQLKTVVKQTIVGTFKDDHVQKEGVDYLERVVKDKQSIQSILDVMLQILQEQSFENQSVVLAKKISQRVVNDKQIEDQMIKLFIRIFDDPEIKFEVGEMVKEVLTDSDTKNALVQLFVDAFQEQPVKDAVKGVLTSSFYDIMMNPETAEKFRIFTYNFFQTYQHTDDKSLLDLIINKVIQKGSKEEIDLDKFFQKIQKNKEQNDSKNIEEIWKNNQKLYE